MMQSGGIQPQFQNVAAPTFAEENAASREAAATNSVKTIVAVVVALTLTVGVGFFAYRLFFSGSNAGNPLPSPTPYSPSAKPSGTAAFVHASVFKKPADQVLALTIPSGSAENASDLATFGQRMIGVLGGAKAPAAFLEMNVKDENSADLPVASILRAGDLEAIDPAFLAAHFNADASFFVYVNATGSWPGFVFTLKPGENWLFVKDDVAKLEASPKLANFFLTVPGVPVDQMFKDMIVAGQPTRILRFSAPGAVFVYGWFHNALIISTSEEGLREAIGGL